MTLDTVIMLFGAFVAFLPFLQFPLGWQSSLSFIAGIIVIGLGIVVRRRRGTWESAMRQSQSSEPQPYGENNDAQG